MRKFGPNIISRIKPIIKGDTMIKRILFVVFILSISVWPATEKRFGLGAMFSDFSLSSPSISLRYILSPKYCVDAGFGIRYLSEIKQDTTVGTYFSPSRLYFNFNVGGSYCVYENKQTKVHLMLDFQVCRYDHQDYATVYDSQFIPIDTKVFKYAQYDKMLSLLVEPNYFLSEDLSIYTRFGLALEMLSPSKYHDASQVLRSKDEEVKLISRKDEQSVIKSTAPLFNLGVRFYF